MEKHSTIDRVVGNVPEREKESILKRMEERFGDQEFSELAGKEREKTSDERYMIFLADMATTDLRRRYGLPEFSVPEENIHIIRKDQWPKDFKSGGFFDVRAQGVCIPELEGRIRFASVTFHEIVHMKSHGALQVPIKASVYEPYRSGLRVFSRDGKKQYFTNLNEAVTEELTRIFVLSQLDHPFFAEEARQSREVVSRYPSEQTSQGNPLFTESAYFADVREEHRPVPGFFNRILGRRATTRTFYVTNFAYARERAVLRELIEKIRERNADRYEDEDAIFEVFARGMITGNILPLGRLIDRTFGEGAFRKIGELDSDIDEQERFVHSL